MGDPQLVKAHQILVGDQASILVQQGLTQLVGDPGKLMVKVERIYFRPDAEATVGYRVSFLDRADCFVVITTAPVGTNVARIKFDDIDFTMWIHPEDPKLLGLAEAADVKKVTTWLAMAGEKIFDEDQISVKLVSYSPLRYAVLKIKLGSRSWYLKLARRRAFAAMKKRYYMLAQVGLSPNVLSQPAPNVLLMDSAAGEPLFKLLSKNSQLAGLPRPMEYLKFLDRLPSKVNNLKMRKSWSERADFHAASAINRIPEDKDRIILLAKRITDLTYATRKKPVPTHGDFYDANLFISNGHPVSLIDLESIGPGQRADDLGCLIAHMVVLPDLSPGNYSHIPVLVKQLETEFEQTVSPDALCIRVAGVVLSLIAGTTSSHAKTRLQIAERWAEKAFKVI